jgi:hypothetical protein
MTVWHFVVLIALLSVLVGLDLARTLRTGRARGRASNITLQGQPERYWRYVYASCAILALCAVALLWMIVSPGTFALKLPG